ncbi:MAG: FKBP-type peptidyl-prolyl cis-trans isomerase [Nitrospina sp.]|nr:FKBP-type peptidyl-prolyl cis-trans isomerase [Nitrospina sp.]
MSRMKTLFALSMFIFTLTFADYVIADSVRLTKIDTKIGAGKEAILGKMVSVHYTGWLFDKSISDNKGKKFDSSRDRSGNFTFPLGAGRVIKGWDQGVQGMKVGGQRTLIIPSSMGYGTRGAGNIIPPNATLIFDVELMGVQ